jgi:hypothetical protein
MTLRSSIYGLTSSLLLLTACGGASSEGPPPDGSLQTAATKPAPEPQKAPEKSAAAQPTAEATSAPAPKAEPPAGPAHDANGPDGVRRWASWDGPKTGPAITAKRAWVFAPNLSLSGLSDLSFGAIALTLVDVEKADANEVVWVQHGSKYAVPNALARAAETPKGLKKGSAAVCSFGGSSIAGRIESADAKSVTCAFRFINKTRKEKLKPEEVIPIDGKLGMGVPVFARFEANSDEWYTGEVVVVSGEDVWVDIPVQFSGEGDPRKGRSVHKIKAANVKPVDVSKPLKVGDACLATNLVRIDQCKVLKVIDGGLAYDVSFGEGDSGGADRGKEWTFDEVAPAPKDDAKKPGTK